MSSRLLAQRLVRQWLHVLCQLPGFRKNFHIFYVMVFSSSEVDSRPALLVSSFTQNGEVHTVDTSVGGGTHGNLDTTFTSPALGSHLLAVFALLLGSFFNPVSDTGGVAGSPGVSTLR